MLLSKWESVTTLSLYVCEVRFLRDVEMVRLPDLAPAKVFDQLVGLSIVCLFELLQDLGAHERLVFVWLYLLLQIHYLWDAKWLRRRMNLLWGIFGSHLHQIKAVVNSMFHLIFGFVVTQQTIRIINFKLLTFLDVCPLCFSSKLHLRGRTSQQYLRQFPALLDNRDVREHSLKQASSLCYLRSLSYHLKQSVSLDLGSIDLFVLVHLKD